MKNKYYIVTTVKIQKERPGPGSVGCLVTHGLRNAREVAKLCTAEKFNEACAVANKGLRGDKKSK